MTTVALPSQTETDPTPARGARHWLRAFAIGVLAGLLGTVSMLLVFGVLRLALGIPTPPESIPDRLAPLLRIPEFFSLFDRFGGYNGLKRFGVTSILAGMIAVGFAIGVLYALAVENGRRIDPARVRDRRLDRAPLVGLGIVVALIWVLSLIGLAPVLDTNFRGLAPAPATAFTVIGWCLACLSFGAIVVLTERFLTLPQSDAVATCISGPVFVFARRSVLALAAGVVGAAVTGGIVRALNARAVFTYDGTQYLGPDIQPITPNDRFYSVTKNVVDPAPGKALWRLEVGGAVTKGHTYRYEELAALSAIEQETTLMCISNGVDGGLMSNARWRGVPLATVLNAAMLAPGVSELKMVGADGYTDTIPIAKALEPTTLLVYEMNGEPLPQTHGFPVRVIVPGMYGEKNVKWVTRLEPVVKPVRGFYAQQGWGPDFTIHPRARIDAPDPAHRITSGMPVTVRGVAFAGDRGVSRVQVSTDDGETWQDASITEPGTKLSWSFWQFVWRPAAPGDYRIVARATDGDGIVQSGEFHDIVPQGARGFHRMTVHVQ